MKYREGINSEFARDKSLKEILENLNKRQLEVYNAFIENGAMYAEQVAGILDVFPHQVTPRILELREMGLLKFSRYGKSATSGKTVSMWEINKEATQIKLQYTE